MNNTMQRIQEILRHQRSRTARYGAISTVELAQEEAARALYSLVQEAKQEEHNKIYALYREMFEPNVGDFKPFKKLTPQDILNFFELLKELERVVLSQAEGGADD